MQVPALAMCVQVEPSLPGHQLGSMLCSLPHASPHSPTPEHAVPVFSVERTVLDLTAPTPLLSAEQFSVTTISVCLPNSTSQIQRSKAWAALPLLPAPRKERVPGPSCLTVILFCLG